ncbi:hypothetical protein G6F40_016195 [Rhizopus arrhizus]|nr:hypothetical protein G6F40_016195 [Rhizopus arrhizus]
MAHRARPRQGLLDGAGRGAGVTHQIRQRVPARVGLHHQHHGQRRDQRDGGEILARVKRHLRHQRRIDGQVGGLPQAQHEPVGLGLGHIVQADVAASARAVLDHDRPAGQAGDLGGDGAGHGIRAAAGRVRHDQPDRPAIGVAAGRLRPQRQYGRAEGCAQE